MTFFNLWIFIFLKCIYENKLKICEIKKAKKIVEKKNIITKVVTNINSEILGGFKLKVGDEIWDESLKEKINQVKEVINNGRFSSSNWKRNNRIKT